MTTDLDLDELKRLADGLHPADKDWSCAICCDGARARAKLAYATPALLRRVEELEALHRQAYAQATANQRHWDDAAAERDALREQVERLTRERDAAWRSHDFVTEREKQIVANLERADCAGRELQTEVDALRSQLSAVKAARDEACDLLDGLSDESIELEQRVRIAELRKAGE